MSTTAAAASFRVLGRVDCATMAKRREWDRRGGTSHNAVGQRSPPTLSHPLIAFVLVGRRRWALGDPEQPVFAIVSVISWRVIKTHQARPPVRPTGEASTSYPNTGVVALPWSCSRAGEMRQVCVGDTRPRETEFVAAVDQPAGAWMQVDDKAVRGDNGGLVDSPPPPPPPPAVRAATLGQRPVSGAYSPGQVRRRSSLVSVRRFAVSRTLLWSRNEGIGRGGGGRCPGGRSAPRVLTDPCHPWLCLRWP